MLEARGLTDSNGNFNLEGEVIGMTSFGESAPGNDLFEHFGLTKEKIIKTLGL